jgi:hypothetical protein
VDIPLAKKEKILEKIPEMFLEIFPLHKRKRKRERKFPPHPLYRERERERKHTSSPPIPLKGESAMMRVRMNAPSMTSRYQPVKAIKRPMARKSPFFALPQLLPNGTQNLGPP